MPPAVAPRLFVSYSHDSVLHKAWVLQLVTRLLANGVDVLLDQWNLTLGTDVASFMEHGIRESDRVLAICSALYVTKANGRSGGVGYEKQILTAQVMANLHSDRVIPLLRNNDEGELPTFLSGRFYIDFRNEANFEQQYEMLLRDILGEQVIVRPPLGQNPFRSEQPTNLSFKRERYVAPALSGRVSFDYSNNNGSYTLGTGDLAFETKWSTAGLHAIHAYTDGANIACLSLAVGKSSLELLGDVSEFDTSSRVRTPRLGEIVIWRNHPGYYLATKIEQLKLRQGAGTRDELTISYLIQSDRTPFF